MSIEEHDRHSGQDRCLDCLYWDGCEDDLTAACLRYPPVPISFPDEDGVVGIVTIYPKPGKNWWCGEFSAEN